MRKLLKRLILKLKFGKKVHFKLGANVTLSSIFEGNNTINKQSTFHGELGYGSYIGSNCFVIAKVGRYSSISDYVSVAEGKHPSKTFVSTSPVFYARRHDSVKCFVNENLFEEQNYAIPEKKISAVIGNDVWIGRNVLILQGVKIGDGAIVAAGSVVTKDVEPYSIVGGVPAKEIRKRFSDSEIEFLLKLEWWNKPLEWIKDNALLFSNINEFKNKLEK